MQRRTLSLLRACVLGLVAVFLSGPSPCPLFLFMSTSTSLLVVLAQKDDNTSTTTTLIGTDGHQDNGIAAENDTNDDKDIQILHIDHIGDDNAASDEKEQQDVDTREEEQQPVLVSRVLPHKESEQTEGEQQNNDAAAAEEEEEEENNNEETNDQGNDDNDDAMVFSNFVAHNKTMTCTADEHARFFNNQVRGVNLGGWMVLEPWITPSLFYQFLGGNENTTAFDTYTFCQVLGPVEANRQLRRHWKRWVTEDIIKELANSGAVNSMRLPVGDYMYKPYGPYAVEQHGTTCFDGALEFVDLLLDWAYSHGLTVMVCF
jgi:hypothetical protein